MTYNFSKKEKHKIIQLFKENEIINTIGKRFNCSGNVIRNILIEKLGIKNYKKISKEHQKRKGKILTNNDNLTIGKLFKNGTNLKIIRESFNISNLTIHKSLIKIFGIREYKKIAKDHKNNANVNNAVKANRATASKVELRFKNVLEKYNFNFCHQYRIENYIVDFIIFPNIVVEIDGVWCHSSKDSQFKDQCRNKKLREMKYKIIRFWDYEINDNIEKCIKKVIRVI